MWVSRCFLVLILECFSVLHFIYLLFHLELYLGLCNTLILIFFIIIIYRLGLVFVFVFVIGFLFVFLILKVKS